MNVPGDLAPLLGCPPDAATAKRVSAHVHGPRDDLRSDAVLHWTWKAAGISLEFRDETMTAIDLNAIPIPGYSRCEGTLPHGLAIDACRREIHATLGAPLRQGAPEPLWCDAADYFHDDTEPHIIGYSYYWDDYEYAGCLLHFLYDWEGEPRTGHRVGREVWQGDPDTLRATFVRLARPSARR